MIFDRNNSFAKAIILFFLFLIVNKFSFCQYYDIGQDPASICWKFIKTEHFKIIYPKQNEKQAQYLANYIEKIYKNSTKTLVSKPRNIPIILHTESVVSNAFTIWAPKRIEFFTIPPQDTYGQEWLQQLAIHEFRHVVQINKINQGFSKIFYYAFGEQITASILGLYIPAWFMEGDAVCAETGLSNTGRGRIPTFEMELKTQTLNGKIYKYDKAVFGSYKDFTPNQYILGYHLTAYARKKYNAAIWNNTIDFVARHPLGITSFSRGIKKNTEINKTKLYYNTLKELDSLWRCQQSLVKYTTQQSLTESPKTYTNYKHPHYLNDSTIIVVKKGVDDITRFISIDRQKREKKLFTPGFLFSETFSVIDSTIVWVEVNYDLRWDNRKYSIIKTYDLKTDKCKSIQPKSFLFTPDLSKDKKYIVAIENTPLGENNIVIIENESGNILRKIKSPENTTLLTPSWNDNSTKIVFIAVSDLGKSLMIYNMETNQYSTIIPYSYEEISKPIFHENYIIYNAGYTGIDNIFTIDTNSKQKFQITSSVFGAENANFSSTKNNLIYSDYTAIGYRISEINTDANKWIKYDTIKNNSIKLYETIANQEQCNEKCSFAADSIYKSKSYSKIKNIFNVHSWAPLSIDADNESINPGVSVLSQNLLSTAFTSLGYKYGLNEKTGSYYANFTYKGFFPVIDFNISKGERASTYLNENKENIRFEWHETKINTGFYIPFNISKGKYYRLIEPEIKFSNTYIQHSNSTPSNFIEGEINTLEYSILFYNQKKSVEKDMRARWGQLLEFRYSNTPLKGLNLGEIYSLSSKLNFPGIIKHHSFRVSLGYQKKNYGTYVYSDFISLPRGMQAIRNKEMKTIFLDYKLPLIYPDISLPNFIYIKRIKANLFYDYALFNNFNNISKFQSMGIEATMDFHLFRFIAPIDAGLRITYSLINKHTNTEFLYQIKFDNL